MTTVSSQHLTDSTKEIVFYDGACGLCSRFVQFILDVDKRAIFSLTPLQGETAKKLLPEQYTKALSTLVVIDNLGKIHLRSAAVFYILRRIGGVWRALAIIDLLPRALCDWAYNQVALRRHKLFPAPESCRLPSVEEQKRFLE